MPAMYLAYIPLAQPYKTVRLATIEMKISVKPF